MEAFTEHHDISDVMIELDDNTGIENPELKLEKNKLLQT